MKYKMNLIYLIIFLILILTINSIMSPIVIKEYFIANDALPIKLFNGMGRNLIFPYFGSINVFTAAQRAKLDFSRLVTNPVGKCLLNSQKNGVINDSYSIINEDYLFYNLIKSCVGLNINNYRFENNNNTLILSFDITILQNLENLSKFLLVNSLFVEFNFNNTSSIAYIMNTNPLYFSNALDIPLSQNYISHKNKNNIELTFEKAVPLESGNCDTVFNYKTFSPSQNVVTVDQMDDVLKNGIVNISVYYLDNLVSNFQNIGRNLIITDSTQLLIMVFDKDYKKLSNDPFMKSTYEFMNNIAMMYYNYIIPVFSVSFDIKITSNMFNNMFNDPANNIQELMNCKMDNTFGGTDNCQNNIFALRFYPDQNNTKLYKLALLIGDNNNCGFNTKYSPILWLDLPWLNDGNIIKISLSIGPNQKYMYAEWTNNNNSGKQIIYAKNNSTFINTPYDICNYKDFDVTNINNLTRLFASKSIKPRPLLENINLISNKKYVTNVNSFSLGYTNFNNNFIQ